MRVRFVGKSLLVAGACAFAIALSPAQSIAQKSKTKVQIPAGGCAVTNAALENGQTCAAKCNSETQWCPVQWCLQGKLEQTVFSCWEPSGVCNPKC
jgi:DNA-binding transcriptional regulator YdaS (Cro superfamily)